MYWIVVVKVPDTSGWKWRHSENILSFYFYILFNSAVASKGLEFGVVPPCARNAETHYVKRSLPGRYSGNSQGKECLKKKKRERCRKVKKLAEGNPRTEVMLGSESRFSTVIQCSVPYHTASALIPAISSGNSVFIVRILMSAQTKMKNLGSKCRKVLK